MSITIVRLQSYVKEFLDVLDSNNMNTLNGIEVLAGKVILPSFSGRVCVDEHYSKGFLIVAYDVDGFGSPIFVRFHPVMLMSNIIVKCEDGLKKFNAFYRDNHGDILQNRELYSVDPLRVRSILEEIVAS